VKTINRLLGGSLQPTCMRETRHSQ